MNKRNTVLGIVVAGSLLAVAGIALAQSAMTGDAMMKKDTMMKKEVMVMKNTPKPMVLTISASGNVLLRGTVKSVSTDSFSVTTWGGAWTVVIVGDTEFAHTSGLGSMEVGDFVGIMGTVSAESPTITAKYVRNWTEKKEAMMMKKEDAMMNKDTMMAKKDDAMMMKDSMMAKKDDAMMMKDSMMMKADKIVLNTATSAELGAYLVAGNGMTLYHFTKDAAGLSTCTGECAAKWPPYIVSAGAPIAVGTGIMGNISTITRADGTMQVRYNGEPLYFWAKDMKVGDTTGHNVNGVWFVVKP